MPKDTRHCIDSLRHNEYYDMQDVYDELYKKSKENSKFPKLMDIILSENNILLAYRNIKTNGGSITPGTDNRNIKDIAKMQPNEVVEMVRYIVQGEINMKYITSLLVIMICAIMLCSCAKEKEQETINFDEKFCESIIEVQYVSFDSKKEVYKDKETIIKLLDILKSLKLEEKEIQDYIEGMYTLYLVSEDNIIEIGFESETIAINGAQYKVNKEIKTNIFECLDMEIE